MASAPHTAQDSAFNSSRCRVKSVPLDDGPLSRNMWQYYVINTLTECTSFGSSWSAARANTWDECHHVLITYGLAVSAGSFRIMQSADRNTQHQII
jgi:hypothetical protein